MRIAFHFIAAFLAASSLSAPPALAEGPLPASSPDHVPEPAGLCQGAMHGYTPDTVKGATVVDTARLAEMIGKEHPLLLDVAEKDPKPPGMGAGMIWSPTHRSLPGAAFLKGGGSGTDDEAYVEDYRSRVAALTGGDKAKPIVTLCHPDCWGSYNAAKRLAGLGYTHVHWYRDGVEGWQADHNTQVVRPDAAWIVGLPKVETQ